MNETIVEETGWASLAMLIESKASIYVVTDMSSTRPRHRVVLKLYFMPHAAPHILAWMREKGRKVESYQLAPNDGKPTQYWVRFVDREVGKILAETHPYIFSDLRRRQYDLVFRFFKTRQRPGSHLLPEERELREAVVKQLTELHTKAG